MTTHQPPGGWANLRWGPMVEAGSYRRGYWFGLVLGWLWGSSALVLALFVLGWLR